MRRALKTLAALALVGLLSLIAMAVYSFANETSERLTALESRLPLLSDYEPDGAIRTQRSVHDGDNPISGDSAAAVTQRYVSASGDQSRAASLELMDDFRAQLLAQGWEFSEAAGSTPADPSWVARQGDVLRLFLQEPRSDPGRSELWFRIQDRP